MEDRCTQGCEKIESGLLAHLHLVSLTLALLHSSNMLCQQGLYLGLVLLQLGLEILR